MVNVNPDYYQRKPKAVWDLPSEFGLLRPGAEAAMLDTAASIFQVGQECVCVSVCLCVCVCVASPPSHILSSTHTRTYTHPPAHTVTHFPLGGYEWVSEVSVRGERNI